MNIQRNLDPMASESPHVEITQEGSALQLLFPYRAPWYELLPILLSDLVLVIAVGSLLLPLLSYSGPGIFLPTDADVFFVGVFLLMVAFVLPLQNLDLLWGLFGQEVIEVDDDGITVKHRLFGVDIRHALPADKVKGLYLDTFQNNWSGRLFRDRRRGFWYYNQGKISLNTRSMLGFTRHYRVGRLLSDEEAERVTTFILQKYPKYRPEI